MACLAVSYLFTYISSSIYVHSYSTYLEQNTLGIEIHNVMVIKSSIEWLRICNQKAKNLRTKAICIVT